MPAVLLLTLFDAVAVRGEDPGMGYLAQATTLLAQGRAAEAGEILRQARERYRDGPLYPEVLLQSARAALDLGDVYRARYFLAESLRLARDSPTAEQAGRLLGDLLYADGMWVDAYAAYEAATRAKGWGDESGLRLRMAEIALEHLNDTTQARAQLDRVDQARLDPQRQGQYQSLRARSAWEHWPSSRLGLEDPNISALALDGDDLWIGTWSGGLSRYARSSGVSVVFRQEERTLVANTIRAIHVTSRHVWVGTDQGLSQYSKALSAWREIEIFGGRDPKKVQAAREFRGRMYVATLGDGLWRLEGERWVRVGQGVLPTAYLTTLGQAADSLLVGTMDAGLVLLPDPEEDPPTVHPVPALEPRNITSVLEQGDRLWVGTYGQGLWEWDRRSGSMTRHDVRTGDLKDDWVMCAALADDTVYFGTFGGGVSYVGPDGRWGRIGLADGLGSLDVLAIEADQQAVYFGTLGDGLSVLHRDPGSCCGPDGPDRDQG